MRSLFRWLPILALPVIIFAFQNCGEGYSAAQFDETISNQSSSSSSTSDPINTTGTTDPQTADPLPTPPVDTGTPPVLDAPPTISSMTKGGVLVAGAQITLKVTAGGANLKYLWNKNNVAIAGATGPTLTLNPLTVANAGTYSVMVMNSGGMASSSATFTVIDFNNIRFVSPSIINSKTMEITHTIGSRASGRYVYYIQNTTTVAAEENFVTRFRIGEMVLLADGKYGHRFEQYLQEAHSITPRNIAAVNTYNTNKLCGLTNWQLNVAKSLIGSTCVPSATAVTYGLSRVAVENNLRVHYIGNYTGVAKTAYPTSIDAATRAVAQ